MQPFSTQNTSPLWLFSSQAEKWRDPADPIFFGGKGKNNATDDKATTGATYLHNSTTIHNTTHTFLQCRPVAAVTNSTMPLHKISSPQRSSPTIPSSVQSPHRRTSTSTLLPYPVSITRPGEPLVLVLPGASTNRACYLRPSRSSTPVVCRL